MDNSRKLAIDIIGKILDQNLYSNVVLNAELKNANIDMKDKGLTTEIVYGTIKYKYTIDKILVSFLREGIKKADHFILNTLRTAIYQIRYLDKVPEFAAVNEAVELTKKYKSIGASKLVNGVLRNYLRNKEKEYYDKKNNIDRLCFEYSFEPWMVKLFIKQYGEALAEKILSGLNSIPPVTVRVNNLKTTYENAWDTLKGHGYEIEEGFICPEAIKIIRGKSIENNPLFIDGLLTVQDESAMLVAPTLEPKEGMTVLDLCSAPGGKTTHISEIMNTTGKVAAFDVHENKLSLIKKTAQRLGINNISYAQMDASIYREDLKLSADRVLLDVPCSGLGIIRKKPEIKWTKDKKQLNEIVEIQKSILKNGSAYVKVNGILVYSTCTLNKEENEENIKWFLKEFPEFSIEPLFYGKLDNIVYNGDGTVTILPNDSMDGFYIAKFKRQR